MFLSNLGRKIHKIIRDPIVEGILHENENETIERLIAEEEIEANLNVSMIMLFLGVLEVIIFLIALFGIVKTNKLFVLLILFGGFSLLIGFSLLCIAQKGEERWTKNVILNALLLSLFGINILTGFKCCFLFSIPIALSCRFYNRRLTIMTGGASVFLIVASEVCNVFIGHYLGGMDINVLEFTEPYSVTILGRIQDSVRYGFDVEASIKHALLVGALPNVLIAILVTIISVIIIQRGRKLLLDMDKQVIRENEMEYELSDLNAKLMLSQIQPHFIYNTLNIIQYLTEEDPELASKAILYFSKYLRGNMKAIENRDLISFREELEHVNAFVEIEKIRFDNLEFVYDIQDTNFRIPPLTLQPLVENAVRHGIRGLEHGTVWISSWREGRMHVVVVEDNGVGFDPEKVKNDGKTHIGLKNMMFRVENLAHGTIEVQSRPGEGTRVEMRIPD